MNISHSTRITHHIVCTDCRQTTVSRAKLWRVVQVLSRGIRSSPAPAAVWWGVDNTSYKLSSILFTAVFAPPNWRELLADRTSDLAINTEIAVWSFRQQNPGSPSRSLLFRYRLSLVTPASKPRYRMAFRIVPFPAYNTWIIPLRLMPCCLLLGLFGQQRNN